MDKYWEHFVTAAKHSIEKLGESGTINFREEMHDLTYESASLGLFGSVIEAQIPLATQGDKEKAFKDAQLDVIKGYVQHATEPEFYEDTEYRLKSNSLALQNLQKDYGTIAGAVEGLAVARIGQLDEGAEA